ncbi:MAG TPA: GWxTD domain-containing protein [Candidatus Eisenbacteria bacterium]|nr:GWxTD domain-containing protein [Candidatus Eisenbacteria bacterium]
MRRSRTGQAIVAAAALLVLASGSPAAPPPPGSVAEGEAAASAGEIHFHARAIPYRHSPSEGRAEFSIRVPYREIKFIPKTDSLFEGLLRVTVEMWDAAEKRIGYRQQEARVQVTDLSAAGDSLLGEVYKLGLTAKPGRYAYRVTVEDMNMARMGLVYKMKNQKRQGKVEGLVDLGPWLFRNPSLSGIEPAWEISAAKEGAPFRKGPYDVYPHPSGYYGLYKDEVSGYYEIYDDPPPPEGRSYRVRSLLVSSKGDTIPTGEDSLRVTEGTAWPHAISIDATGLAAGHYRLALEIRREGQPVSAGTSSEFDILWSRDSWRPDAAEFYDVAAGVLLSSEDAAKFPRLSMGEKEVRIEEAWQSADPSPETAENEARIEFLRRVAYANQHYTIFTPGMFSDRGRVYIRYGEPDEMKIERLPVAGKTIGHVLDSSIPQASRETITRTDTGIADSRPYEIWTYNSHGHEASARHGLNEVASGLKFVFIDDQGYGEYTLRYSSTTGIH